MRLTRGGWWNDPSGGVPAAGVVSAALVAGVGVLGVPGDPLGGTIRSAAGRLPCGGVWLSMSR